MFDTLTPGLNLLIFSGLAAIMWASGSQLSYFIDAIAEKTKLARAFMGLVLLATATELPEMVTTLMASASGNGQLALNNMFGGVMLQLVVLAIADIFIVGETLTSRPQTATTAVAGLLSILSLALLMIFYITGDVNLIAPIGLGSILAGIFYILSLYLLKKHQNRDVWSPVDLPEEEKSGQVSRQNRYDSLPLIKLISWSLAFALMILISGVALVHIAETLARQTGVSDSFIGVSLLAITTSLPELSTCIAAVKLKAYTMAISNIFGSNLIMTFLLVPADIFYREGPLLDQMGRSSALALAGGISLTTIYSLGLLIRPKIRIAGMGADSFIVLIFYIVFMIILFHLS